MQNYIVEIQKIKKSPHSYAKSRLQIQGLIPRTHKSFFIQNEYFFHIISLH